MATTAHAPALLPALATGIGSLPHTDAVKAAAFELAIHPRFPSAPQLPNRSPFEGMVVEVATALDEIDIADDGTLTITDVNATSAPTPHFGDAHSGLLAFLDAAGALEIPPPRVKIQLAGPLTLGIALAELGVEPERAFQRAAATIDAWAVALEDLVAERLPQTTAVLFLDEPALAAWRGDEGPIHRDLAVDILSGVLATVRGTTGVHACSGDRRLAFEAGPDIVGIEATPDVVADADVIGRYLDGDGWIAWGAVPTDRPVRDSAEPYWRSLVELWCELTMRGCDPVQLRTQSVITPACGLASHGVAQAEHVLELVNALADHVHDQAVAARLTLGA